MRHNRCLLRNRFWTFPVISIILSGVFLSGCSSYRPFMSMQEISWQLKAPTEHNPIFVPAYDHDFLWEIVVDVVDSYFPKISREMRIRLHDGVLTEGRLDTKPVIGASLMEPWHRDSVGLQERIDCTTQTIQRRAEVRVTPENGGYHIAVFVYKELEHNTTPLQATASVANLRFEDDADSFATRTDVDPSSSGWIHIGRDYAMEEQLLKEIVFRLKNPPKLLKKAREPIRG